MFEQPAGNEEKDRSRVVMILSGAAVILVIVLIILVTSFGKRPGSHETAAGIGSAEFDSYKDFVRIDSINKSTGERLNTRFGHITCKVANTGDRVLSALQLRAAAIDLGDVTVREKIITPVPKLQETLGPNQSIDIDVYLEPIPDPATLKDMIIELYGLKVK